VQDAWKRLQDRKLTDVNLAGEYVDFLVERGEFVLAGDTWTRDLGSRDENYLNRT
jgi:hypothetical protein